MWDLPLVLRGQLNIFKQEAMNQGYSLVAQPSNSNSMENEGDYLWGANSETGG
jgi:hypothetical protein